jgi:hypothetical protein
VSDGLGLSEALGVSEKQRALYDDGERRAYVSMRNENFDVGVKNAAGKVSRFDQTAAVLHTLLSAYGVPMDTGWKPQ